MNPNAGKGQYIGYLKYSGKLVEEGLLDARKSAQALLGFDEAVRFFVGQQIPELKQAEYELPVRIREGSWESLIPTTIGQWVTTGIGIATTAYLANAAKKMAEKDFEGVGLKDVFAKSLRAIQWVIRIGKHVGDLAYRRFENIKFQSDNREVGIPNSEGKYLFVPKEYLDMYLACSPKLLLKVAELVEEERLLAIGVYENNTVTEETLPKKYRHIFTQEELETEDILFPELKHGQVVSLEGDITRGNESTNSLGFKYRDHILTCYPETGSIVRFKASLFLQARMHGTINRLDEDCRIAAKKPKIIFTHIESLDSATKNKLLF